MAGGRGRRLEARRVAEVAFGVALVALALFARDVATGFPVRARAFPMALVWCLGAVGVGLSLSALLRPGPAEANAGWRRAISRLIVPSLTLVVGFATLRGFGFYVAAPLLVAAFHVTHALTAGEPLTPGLALRAAIFAAVATAAMWTLFSALLGLPAPSGALF
ncbi:tripartite tricarboxylate transporter TctB family protein [Rubrimonas sp.]|uniref:tripartite tricarboxylate transporter TctB family protein n=1 Tax=Rubrimonas sp. TaxID=2036015 RepID=UPI002FDEB3D3